MARAGVGWTVETLAKHAGVGRMTVVRFEAGEAMLAQSVEKIETALEGAGVQFSGRSDRVGVIVRNRDCRSDPS
jgi:DNA-binding XRE family transcriptional regulator